MKHTRRNVLGAMIGGAFVASGVSRDALANTGAQLPVWGDDEPGTAKAGPLGLTRASASVQPEIPVAIVIPAAEVDAEIEVNKIVNGQMLDPTGPWIVSWYEGTGLLGEPNRNLLMSGHVDYWGVGPAVFRSVASLSEGAEVTIYGDKGGSGTYAVEYVRRFSASPTPEELAEITGPTEYEAVTLITCGGEFDYDAGAYLQRDIVRCRLVDLSSGDEEAASADVEIVDETPPPAREDGQPTTVTEDGVNVRSDASTGATAITAVNVGDVVTVTGEPVDADGYTWYPIQLEDGTEGWVVGDFLDLPE